MSCYVVGALVAIVWLGGGVLLAKTLFAANRFPDEREGDRE